MTEEPIRILHVLGGLKIGGAESFVMNLYRAVDRSRIQFDFVKHTSEEGNYEPEIQKLGGRIYVCPKYVGTNHFTYCSWWNHFFKAHPEYHIVHGHVRSTAAIYLRIANQKGLTTISHSHSTSNGSGISAQVKNLLQKPIRNIADYLFSCSEESGRWLFGDKALQKSNYHMIPNGVDFNRFSYSEERRNQIRKELNLGDTFVIGHVGRFSEPKNHIFLIDTFEKLLSQIPDAHLILVGDGPLLSSVGEHCKELHVENSVSFLGARTNTEDYYSAMDVFAFPSLWEGLPVSVVEAQTSGLPCLLSSNVTRDVALTDLVEYLDLKEGTAAWAKRIARKNHFKRMGLDLEKNQEIIRFDGNNVANWLTEFYLSHFEDKIRR